VQYSNRGLSSTPLIAAVPHSVAQNRGLSPTPLIALHYTPTCTIGACSCAGGTEVPHLLYSEVVSSITGGEQEFTLIDILAANTIITIDETILRNAVKELIIPIIFRCR